MKADFLDFINKHSMLRAGQSVCVGVSGGADSMCLLHLLNSVRSELGISIIAAHVNHCIRGDEADSDEQFVIDFCKLNNIEIITKRIDVPVIAKETGESIELCARRLRYEFFQQLQTDIIATAHTGSDRIETLLMNLSRGAALDGLCSIPPVRANIIRPLLNFTRNDIERYCSDNNISFVTDSTNLSNDYTRNCFRHKIIHELIDINPAFEQNALRCINLINDDNDVLENIVENYLEQYLDKNQRLDTFELKGFSEALKRRIIIGFLKKNQIYDYSNSHICLICDNLADNFSVMLPGAVKISCDSHILFIDNLPADASLHLEPLEFNKNDEVFYKSISGIIHVYNTLTLSEYEKNSCYVVDFDKVDETLIFRSRSVGDKITLGKRKCTKSIKKLLNEMKIPVKIRDTIAVLADKNGVIFIEDIASDSLRSFNTHTKKYLIIEKKGF